MFIAIFYSALATLFLSTSQEQTEFSPRIDFFGLMYVYSIMLSLALRSKSTFIKNLATLFALFSIIQSANTLFEAQKVWKLGFDAEMKAHERIVSRIENHKDFRRARAAALSMIPTSTGAAKAIGLVLPKLDGKLDGIAIRVPTPDVSVVELVVNTKRKATVDAVNAAMRANVSKTFGYNELPLVSVDFTHDDHSSVFDATQTRVLGDNLIHVTAWYDNEWGFSNRMSDTAVAMGKLL